MRPLGGGRLLGNATKWALTLLYGSAALLACMGFVLEERNDSKLVWQSSHELEVAYLPLDQPQPSAVHERLRQHWLRLAPTEWEARVVGIGSSDAGDEVVLTPQQQWVLLLGDPSVVPEQQRAVALIGRLFALDRSNLLLDYRYPPQMDPALQRQFLQEDSALVPPASFLLFQPELGRSLIPFDDSLIARYAAAFRPDTRMVSYLPELSPPAAQPSDPLADFIASWLALIYPSQDSNSRQAELAFLTQNQELAALTAQVKAKLDPA